MWKRGCAFVLVLALCLMTSGCRKREETQMQAVPSVKIAFSSYQYDQTYINAEGWSFETVLTDQQQLNELDRLMEGIAFEVTDRAFELDRGYWIVWCDREGNVTREEMILSPEEASREGVIFEMSGAQPLYDWLEALKLDEETSE